MRIVFAVEDNKGRKKCYVTDDCVVRSPAEVIEMMRQGILQDVFIVHRNSTPYLKSKNSAPQNIDEVTAPFSALLNQSFADDKHATFLLQAFNGRMRSSSDMGGYFESEDKRFLLTKQIIADRLLSLRPYIEDASTQFNIDKYLLAAILADEILRFAPFELITDFLQAISNKPKASVGVAQVQLRVAKELIQNGYYSPDPSDLKLARDRISKTSYRHISIYAQQDRYSVFFGAAKIRATADFWEKAGFPIGNDILATLYSIGQGDPKPNPQASPRGSQIATEFYEFAKTIL